MAGILDYFRKPKKNPSRVEGKIADIQRPIHGKVEGKISDIMAPAGGTRPRRDIIDYALDAQEAIRNFFSGGGKPAQAQAPAQPAVASPGRGKKKPGMTEEKYKELIDRPFLMQDEQLQILDYDEKRGR